MNQTQQDCNDGTLTPRLSICISTYNRAGFLGETLNSILCQMTPEVELLVLDGASPDNTAEVMATYLMRYPKIRYIREKQNSGVDCDYDKAVGYATGDYCWLMTDDDLLKAGAIARVLSLIEKHLDLIVVNSEVRNVDFSKVLQERFCSVTDDREYAAAECGRLFTEAAEYLSFIGGVVIRRAVWLERERQAYFGTLFIHVGVIFQKPLIAGAMLISDPLITIRYGNALWTSRGFEIWMFKWPELIWSFPGIPDSVKAMVYPKEPWRQVKKLVLYRAIGAYSMSEYRRFFPDRVNRRSRIVPMAIALCPAKLANSLGGVYCLLLNRQARVAVYDLARSKHATWVARLAARSIDV